MRPYQIYLVKEMPTLTVGQELSSKVQLTFSGENEDVRTSIKLENDNFDSGMSMLHVESEIKHRTFGFIRKMIHSERQKIEFFEYLEPVKFPAYLDHDRKIILFNAPKKACRGVLSYLRDKPCGLELVEMEVDFVKLMERTSEYLGAWFRGVSSRVQAAGLSGNQIQDDKLFQSLKKAAQMSNVTIPWNYGDFEHSIMVTSGGAVVLVQNYAGNVALELRIVADVYDRLLRHVWQERKCGGKTDDSPGEP
jgi:hypothetical protein